MSDFYINYRIYVLFLKSTSYIIDIWSDFIHFNSIDHKAKQTNPYHEECDLNKKIPEFKINVAYNYKMTGLTMHCMGKQD